MSPVRTPLAQRASAIVLATVFVDIVGFGMILPILPGHAASLGSSPTTIGLLVGSYSAIQLLLAPFWGRVSDRIGRRPVLLIGLAGSAASYALFAMAGHWWVLLFSRLLDGGSGATINVGQAYLADATAPADRSRRPSATALTSDRIPGPCARRRPTNERGYKHKPARSLGRVGRH
jgi:MFS family permease